MLTENEISLFFDRGWVLREALFDSREIERIRASFGALQTTARGLPETGLCQGSLFVLGDKNGEQVIKRVVWAGAAQPYLLEIGADSRLTVPAAQLLGSREMEQLLCQAHFKRPNDGVAFDWHQDIQHRDKGGDTWRDVNGKGSYVQTLIAVDEMTPDSGPLHFVSGSSRWGRVDFGDHDYDNPASPAREPPQFREADVVTINAKPGDTLFFGPYTAHASFANTSPAYRRAFINGYAYPGANGRVYPGDGAGRKLRVGEHQIIETSVSDPGVV